MCDCVSRYSTSPIILHCILTFYFPHLRLTKISNLKHCSLHCRTIKTISLGIFNSVSAVSDKMVKNQCIRIRLEGEYASSCIKLNFESKK